MANLLPPGIPPDILPWLAIAVGAGVTYVWRALGVAVAGRLNPNGPVFAWVGCVAYALLAGLVARMIILPIGPLRHTEGWMRLSATAVALLVFYLARQNLFLATMAGIATLVGTQLVTGTALW